MLVYVLLADGFEETEAVAPIDVLRRLGAQVVTAGLNGTEITSAHGIVVKTDSCIDDIEIDGADMLVIPGGGGCYRALLSDGRTADLAAKMLSSKRFVGAICAAPAILGQAGLLDGRRAVCYPGMESLLKGAVTCTDPVVRDGFLITGRGPAVALGFAFALAEALFGKADTDKLKTEMCVSASLEI